jgi:hypothetical protein
MRPAGQPSKFAIRLDEYRRYRRFEHGQSVFSSVPKRKKAAPKDGLSCF